MKRKVYTITGGTGYIGAQLIARLCKKDENTIYAIVRETSTKLVGNDNIIYVTYDGTEASIEAALRESDYLIHLGALYTTRTDENSVKDLIHSNVLFSTMLFNLANRVNPDIVIASASTFSELDENGEYAPASLYAATKKAVEEIAKFYTNLSIHFLSLPDTFGPGDWRPKVHNLVRKNTKWPFEFRSPKEQEIRMLHIEDVVGHLLGSLNDSTKGTHFHDIYSEGILLTLEELSKILTDQPCVFSTTAEIVKLPKKARDFSKPTGYKNKYKEVEFNHIPL